MLPKGQASQTDCKTALSPRQLVLNNKRNYAVRSDFLTEAPYVLTGRYRIAKLVVTFASFGTGSGPQKRGVELAEVLQRSP